VLQVLFAAETGKQDPREVLELFERHFSSDRDDALKIHRVQRSYARDLVEVVSRDRESIDELIGQLSHHWKVYRISRVDLNILRMAIAEMTSFPEVPGRVTMDEAVDLGKRYGSDDSAAFINGILDRIYAVQNSPCAARNVREVIARLDEPVTTS